jgi:hypothetical protein
MATAYETARARAAELQRAQPARFRSIEQALADVWRTDAALWARYKAEEGERLRVAEGGPVRQMRVARPAPAPPAAAGARPALLHSAAPPTPPKPAPAPIVSAGAEAALRGRTLTVLYRHGNAHVSRGWWLMSAGTGGAPDVDAGPFATREAAVAFARQNGSVPKADDGDASLGDLPPAA